MAPNTPNKNVQSLASSFDAFKSSFQSLKYDACSRMMSDLKFGLTGFTSLPPFCDTSIPSAAQEHMLARDILEHAVLLSVHLRDSEGFARSFTQLAVHYEACAALGSLPPSQKELPILGLNLLRLLVENRTAEFHAELELLGSDAVNSSVYIRYPVEIEQCLMEGSYAKVLALRQEAPSPECAYFLEALGNTVREELASCVETAYRSMPRADVLNMIACKPNELEELVQTRGWGVADNGSMLTFPRREANADMQTSSAEKEPQLEVISQVLAYARELERIV